MLANSFLRHGENTPAPLPRPARTEAGSRTAPQASPGGFFIRILKVQKMFQPFIGLSFPLIFRGTVCEEFDFQTLHHVSPARP